MAQKTCYVKCVSNEQAQKLRGELVKVGFVDDKDWNDETTMDNNNCIVIYGMAQKQDFEDPLTINIHSEPIASDRGEPLLYTLTPDENLTEAAVKIKELFDNQ